MKKVGILSLQGDFAAHGAAVERAGGLPVYVRERPQFGEIDGLIIPGGESTAMLKLLHYEGLFDDLAEFGQRKPMFGTCAGAILMAKEVSHPSQESLGLIDIAIERNAYGRQIDSRVVEIDFEPDFQHRAG
jgi:5'-phosphate synthase pdxT subunit